METSAVSEEFKWTILRLFGNDAVGGICQNDHAILLVGEKLFAKLQKKPDKKTEVNRSFMADMRKLGNLYLKFSQQNPPSLASPAASLDMLQRRNVPTLEKAIATYTTRDDTDLKAICCYFPMIPILFLTAVIVIKTKIKLPFLFI